MHPVKTVEECHAFWHNPPQENRPAQYAKRQSASFVVSMVEKYLPKDVRILELGCNVGLTLHHLWEAGYRNIEGIEINPEAVAFARSAWPEMRISIYQGAIESHVSMLPEYDLIYSKAVRCHVHPQSEWIFDEIAKRTKYVLTVEDEISFKSGRHFPRDYQKIFEYLDMKQIEFVENVPHMNAAYHARMFKCAD